MGLEAELILASLLQSIPDQRRRAQRDRELPWNPGKGASTAYGFVAHTLRHPPLFRATNFPSQPTLQLESGESMMELTMLNPIWIADLAPAAAPSWIWDGFIAPGSITLFSSPAKTGKTTLLSHLLARRRSGGILLDRVVTAGVTAVVTEESAGDW